MYKDCNITRREKEPKSLAYMTYETTNGKTWTQNYIF
jgi:hypothetical protein